MTKIKKNYIVGKFNYLYDTVLDRGFLSDLYFSEFYTLYGTNWLSNFVIDICLMAHAVQLNLTQTRIILCNTVSRIMNKSECGEESYDKIDVTNYNFIFMPWNVGNHWIIIFVNIAKKNIHYYGSDS